MTVSLLAVGSYHDVLLRILTILRLNVGKIARFRKSTPCQEPQASRVTSLTALGQRVHVGVKLDVEHGTREDETENIMRQTVDAKSS